VQRNECHKTCGPAGLNRAWPAPAPEHPPVQHRAPRDCCHPPARIGAAATAAPTCAAIVPTNSLLLCAMSTSAVTPATITTLSEPSTDASTITAVFSFPFNCPRHCAMLQRPRRRFSSLQPLRPVYLQPQQQDPLPAPKPVCLQRPDLLFELSDALERTRTFSLTSSREPRTSSERSVTIPHSSPHVERRITGDCFDASHTGSNTASLGS